MATFATIADVFKALETDLPDSVLQRHLDTAEDEVRQYLTEKQRATLPVVLWDGRYVPALGESDGRLTLHESALSYPWVRLEGTVAEDGEMPAFSADTDKLEAPGGTSSLVPTTADGAIVETASFNVAVDETGKAFTINTTDTATAVVFTRVLGLQQPTHPARIVSAVIDLVELAVQCRGIRAKRVGQYSITLADYDAERAKVLGRLVYASGESLGV